MYYVNKNASYTQEEWILAKQFQYYWTNLAKYGKPGNGYPDQQVEWKHFEMEKQNLMVLDVASNNGPQIVSKYHEQKCIFWDSIGYGWLTDTNHL